MTAAGSRPAPPVGLFDELVRALDGATPQHVSWNPDHGCVATYHLDAGDGPTIGVVTVGPRGVARRHYIDGDDLPGLRHAADPAVMGPWLAARTGSRVDRCVVVPLRYRPGERAVLRYELDGTVAYGKVLAVGQLARVAAAAGVLAHHGLAPPMIGCAPEWNLIVQSDAGESSLAGGDLSTLSSAGRVLARLHALDEPAAPTRSLAEDVADLEQYITVVDSASDLADPFCAVLDQLRAREDPDGMTVPSHGAFRLDQIHLGPDGPVLIDLDSFAWAQPERDIANLFAYLRWRSIREPGFFHEQARDAFLTGYRLHAVLAIADERMRFFEAASLLKIAGRRFRRLAVGEWARVPALIGAAAALVAMP